MSGPGQTSRRRVLLVVSGFPPVVLADMQRARMLAADLPETGWDVEVLAPGAGFHRAVWIEPEAASLRPKGVPVHEAHPRGGEAPRFSPVGAVGWRALWPMYRLGCRQLQEHRFDLVYITTTQFQFFCLGRLWRRRFGVPYVLDYHDPWVREDNKYVTTPRGLKFQLNVFLARLMEPFALKKAAGLVAVSPDYLTQLARRYPRIDCTHEARRAVIPFGATEQDFDWAHSFDLTHVGGETTPETWEVAYVGAGGSIMAKSFRRFARALARVRRLTPSRVEKLRVRLLGTYAYWADGDPRELQTIAEEEGIGDLVEEHPARVGYRRALETILRARGVLILGVDDPAYMPSKLFTYALTGKPLLASLHVRSQANRYFQEMKQLGHLIHFDGGEAHEVQEDEAVRAFLSELAACQTINRARELEPWLSSAAARRHARFFDTCLAPATGGGAILDR